jgi:hypothetical protein
MARFVCFIDDKDGQYGTCLAELEEENQAVKEGRKYNGCICICTGCNHNPFPGGIVPDDRVLRHPKTTADGS